MPSAEELERYSAPSALESTESQGFVAQMDEALRHGGMYLALAVAWIAMLGSLYFSEVAKFPPCPLCWYQRIFMYSQAVLIGIGLLRRDWKLPTYTIPLSVIGASISVYHLLVENRIIKESAACQAGVPCSAKWINWFGFITIPTLAFAAFIIIILASSSAWRARDEIAALWAGKSMPWKTVLGIVGLITAAFWLLTLWKRMS